jgi:hypothetical protein
MKQEKKTFELKEGMNSGDLTQKIKLHVALNSGGKCCFPDCSKHLIQKGTIIGECAHIIPKKVGFVRENWQTPLEDRKKPANLIFLCSEHHTIIDDPDNANKYPAGELFEWKKKHEEWVLSMGKVNNIPVPIRIRLEKTIASLEEELTKEINISTQLLQRLLIECKTLLRRWYLDKAEILLAQIEILLSDIDNADLNIELKALQADFFWKQGKIPEAKSMYLALLGTSEHAEAMIDYIDLCYSTPEDGDRNSEYEEKLKHIAPDHPRFKLLKLHRQYQLQEKIDTEIKEKKWTDDDWLNGQFYLAYALFFDLAGDLKKRDHFIDQWGKLLPESSRPNLFHILFTIADNSRDGIKQNSDSCVLRKKIQEQEKIISSEEKDPLSRGDRISLLAYKVIFYGVIPHSSLAEPEELRNTRDELFALVLESYFDMQINRLLADVLNVVLIDLTQWKGLVASILTSKVIPSTDVIDLIFLQGLKLQIDIAEIRIVITTYSRSDLADLLNAVEQKNIAKIIQAINEKEEQFKLQFLQSIIDAALRIELFQNVELGEESDSTKMYFLLEAYEASE